MEDAHRSQLLPSRRNLQCFFQIAALRRAFIEGHGFTILSQPQAKNSICAIRCLPPGCPAGRSCHSTVQLVLMPSPSSAFPAK